MKVPAENFRSSWPECQLLQPCTKDNYLENLKDSEAKIKTINYNNNNNYYNIFNFYSADQQKFGALCNIVENL